MSPLVQKEWSPLILASLAGDLEIVQGMVELGAEIDHPTNVREREKLNFVVECFFCVHFTTEKMDSPDVGCSARSHRCGQVLAGKGSIC